MDHKKITGLILNEIEKQDDHKLTDVTCGAHIVGVESSKMGLATWAVGRHPVPLDTLPETGKHASAKELTRYITSDNPVESSLGLAAVNSLLPDIPEENLITINAGDLILDLGKNKRVAVIGHFPFVAKMQNKFKELMVFEKMPQEGDLEEKLIPSMLPEADLVAITATTIANKSLGDILAHCSAGSVKMLIGPSAPVSPALFDLGFDYIAGSVAVNTAAVKEGILKGSSFKDLKGTRHVILQRL